MHTYRIAAIGGDGIGTRAGLIQSTPNAIGVVCPGLTTISDHVSLFAMETIPVSKFKATCLAVLQRVKRTGRPVLITRFGQPVAEVIRPHVRASRSEWLGAMAGRVELSGDIVGPAVDAKTWAAMRR